MVIHISFLFLLIQVLCAALEIAGKTPLGLGHIDGFVHHVIVGGEEKPMFTPDRLNANIGDRVLFDFRSLNHTLTQSSLRSPCSPFHQFDTGFGQFNPDGRKDLSVVLTVNTLSPQWFFCRQSNPFSHCHAGMVFAINPGEKMDEFRRNARNSHDTSRGLPVHASSSGEISRAPTTLRSPSISSITHPIKSGHTMVFFTMTKTKTVSQDCGNTPIVSPISSPTSTNPTVKRNFSGAPSSDSPDYWTWGVSAILQMLMLLWL